MSVALWALTSVGVVTGKDVLGVDIGVLVGLEVGTLVGLDTDVIASFELGKVGTLVGIDKVWLLTWI